MKLGNNYGKIVKFTGVWKLNMLLNNQWVKKKKQPKGNLKQMKIETQHIQNLWDAPKAVLKGKLIVINVYFIKGKFSKR